MNPRETKKLDYIVTEKMFNIKRDEEKAKSDARKILGMIGINVLGLYK